MAYILYDSGRLKIMDVAMQLAEASRKDETWFSDFWCGLMQFQQVYEEFTYYIEHLEFLCRYSCDGYTMADLYVMALQNFKFLLNNTRNEPCCAQETIALEAFSLMINLKKNPESVLKRIQSDFRLDK